MNGCAGSQDALQAVRRTTLDRAAADGERLRAGARTRAEVVLAAARAEAASIVAAHRADAEHLAEAEQRGHLAAARAQVAAMVLSAQQDVLEQARAAARAAVVERWDGGRLEQMLTRLQEDARRRLGGDRPVQIVPVAAGGFIARADDRQIDCSLDSLLDRCVDSLGAELARLWQ